jgi:hypothetical protein
MSNPDYASVVARYHNLDLPQRMSSWMYKQRAFTCVIAPDYVAITHNLTVFMTGALPNKQVYFGWDSGNLVPSSKYTTSEGKYTFSFNPRIMAGTIDLTPGTHLCKFAVLQEDGSFDLYEDNIQLYNDTNATTMGDAFFSRTGSSSFFVTAADVWTTITWDTVNASDGHDTSTTYTAPVNGIYEFHINIRVQVPTGTSMIGLALVINKGATGEIFWSMPTQNPTIGYTYIQISHSLKLNAGDTVTSCVYQSGATNMGVFPELSNYSGYLVRRL